MKQGTSHQSVVSMRLVLFVGGLIVTIGLSPAQALTPRVPQSTCEVASIHPSKTGSQRSSIGPGPQGGMRATNAATIQLLTFAYELRDFQFIGGPGWVRSDRFDLSFTPDTQEVPVKPYTPRDQIEGFIKRNRQRMQALLLDRFGLVLRAETRELPVYAFSLAKGGHKLAPPVESSKGSIMTDRGHTKGEGAYIKGLTETLSNVLGRPVTNETGLDGPFDYKLEWTPEGSDAGGPSIFTALTEQLGLRLESKKGPVQVFVIGED